MEDLKKIIEEEGDFHRWTINCDNIDMECVIIRNRVGALCGYVLLKKDNQLFGLDYDEIGSKISFTPHGGLTYSDDYEGGWLVGFDCAHSGDLCPELNYGFRGTISKTLSRGVYRDLNYVKNECNLLASSLSIFSRRIKNINDILNS